MDDASDKGLKANEQVVPKSEVKKLKARLREPERALGEKTLQVDILEEVVEIAREKKLIARELVRRGRRVKPVAETLGVSGSHLSTTARNPSKPRGGYDCCGDAVLLERIVTIVQARSTYGYCRVTAFLNRQKPEKPVNHKRVDGKRPLP